MNHDDVLIVPNIHGEEERCRMLWKVGDDKVRVKSLTNPHRKAFNVSASKIIRNEGRAHAKREL